MQRLWQRLAAEGTRLFETLVRSLPPAAVSEFMALVGQAIFVFGKRRRRIALENLRIAFGDELTEAERRRLACASFASFGRTMAEMLFAERHHGPRSASLSRMRTVGEGWAQIDEDLAAGRGGMIVTAHFGSWEIGVPFLRHYGLRLHPVVRTLANPFLDAWATASRAGPDGVIRKQGALRQMLSVMRRGGWPGYLGDQNAGKHGVFVPFFGLDASTFPTPGVTVARFGFPAYLAVCVRQPGGVFDVALEKIPEPDPELDLEARILAVLRFVHERLERWIRAYPDQYTWLHRRWKTRPPGEVQGPHLPDYPHKRPSPRQREAAGVRPEAVESP
jgi:KDO2-lipid IV(A) lauroyltransferase